MRTPMMTLVLAAWVALTLATYSPLVQASDAPKTAFKPDAVWFITKRGTNDLPALLAAPPSGAPRAGPGGDDEGPMRVIPRRAPPLSNATYVPPLQQPARAAVPAHGGGGNNNKSPKVQRAWQALNAYDMSVAVGNPRGGVGEPPDQGLAVGNGYVMESVNSAVRIFDQKTAAALTPTVSATAFYKYAPNGPPPNCGDSFFDPITLWDPDLRRWFQIIDRRQNNGDCTSTGRYYIEIAVSTTADPRKAWFLYSLDGTNDGQQGSPILPGCEDQGCFPDYPHCGLDANSLIISTNNFGAGEGEEEGGYVGAGVFVLDKWALAKGSSKVAVAAFMVQNAGVWDSGGDEKVFTLSPAYTPPQPQPKHDHKKKGKDYSESEDPFLLIARSSNSASRLIRGALTGTRAVKLATTQKRLDALKTALTLTLSPVELPVAVPFPTEFLPPQPAAGSFPYGQSLGYTTPGNLADSDQRMQSSTVAAGKHLAVFVTMAQSEGEPQARYAVYLAQLDAKTGAFIRGDVLGEPGENTQYPAVALDRYGKGGLIAMASGEQLYASGVFYPIDKDGNVGERSIPLEGQGLDDGFTQYVNGGVRPRNGDYAAACIDHRTGFFYGAVNYFPTMSCTLEEYNLDKTCGGTRARVANWNTGIAAFRL